LYFVAEFSPSRINRLTSEIGYIYSDFRCIALSDLPPFCSLDTAEVVMVFYLLYLVQVAFEMEDLIGNLFEMIYILLNILIN
jgi:hypothetical protein